jgi:hypothetical protein
MVNLGQQFVDPFGTGDDYGVSRCVCHAKWC